MKKIFGTHIQRFTGKKIRYVLGFVEDASGGYRWAGVAQFAAGFAGRLTGGRVWAREFVIPDKRDVLFAAKAELEALESGFGMRYGK